MSTPNVPSLRLYAASWLAILALLALTIGAAYLPMAGFNVVVNLSISLLSTWLMMSVFMELRAYRGMVRIAAAAGFLWLTFLLVLMFGDYLTRHLIPAGV